MLWVVLAFLTAFFRSLVDVFGKKGLGKVDEYVIAWSWRVFGAMFLLPLLFFIGIPSIGKQFWLALLISGGFNSLTTLLYMKAIKSSDLSITVPIVSFTPLFLMITSPLILGESPSPLGVIGIAFIVLGSYLLNLKQVSAGGFLAPFRALLHEKGPRLMLLVAFIWSITANVDKIGLRNSSPIFWALAINVIGTFVLLPVMLLKSKNPFGQMKGHFSTILLPMAFFSAVNLVTHMLAISIAIVPYVIAIKRTSTVMSVLWGYFLFKEGGMKERLSGAVVMLVGVALITLLG